MRFVGAEKYATHMRRSADNSLSHEPKYLPPLQHLEWSDGSCVPSFPIIQAGRSGRERSEAPKPPIKAGNSCKHLPGLSCYIRVRLMTSSQEQNVCGEAGNSPIVV